MPYGPIARLKVKEGKADELMALNAADDSELAGKLKGYNGAYVLQSDNDPNELYLTVVFNSKEDYQANARSPEQDQRYQKMRALLDADPEWHDGEWIYMTAPQG
jgi:heme-degrading monooxygenase HmoA